MNSGPGVGIGANMTPIDVPVLIKAIITGATGMVGEGVLLECLEHPDVEQVLVINRRPGGVSHPKLREIVHADFFDLKPIEPELVGFNACFFCLGVSSVGMSTEEYKRRYLRPHAERGTAFGKA